MPFVKFRCSKQPCWPTRTEEHIIDPMHPVDVFCEQCGSILVEVPPSPPSPPRTCSMCKALEAEVKSLQKYAAELENVNLEMTLEVLARDGHDV